MLLLSTHFSDRLTDLSDHAQRTTQGATLQNGLDAVMRDFIYFTRHLAGFLSEAADIRLDRGVEAMLFRMVADPERKAKAPLWKLMPSDRVLIEFGDQHDRGGRVALFLMRSKEAVQGHMLYAEGWEIYSPEGYAEIVNGAVTGYRNPISEFHMLSSKSREQSKGHDRKARRDVEAARDYMEMAAIFFEMQAASEAFLSEVKEWKPTRAERRRAKREGAEVLIQKFTSVYLSPAGAALLSELPDDPFPVREPVAGNEFGGHNYRNAQAGFSRVK